METNGLAQIKLLVNLARIDGEIGPKEKELIINIGQANHLLVAEILPLFSSDYPLTITRQLTEDERFSYLTSLIRLMKIDGKLYKEEMKYCAQVAAKLGYQEQVMFDLIMQLNNSSNPDSELDVLKRLSSTYLRKS